MLRHWYYPLLAYRSIVVPFLIVSAVAVTCWVVVRLVRRRDPAHRVAIGFSVGIEVLQLVSKAWGSYRTADVNDVILNGVGAAIGVGIVFLLRRGRVTRAPVSEA